MSAVQRLLPCAVGLASLALALPVQAGPGVSPARGHETWISIERSVAETTQAAWVASGRDPLVLEGEGNVVIAQVREADVEFLSRVLHKQLHHCGGFMGHSNRDAAFDAAARANRPETVPITPGPAEGYTIDNGPVAQAMVAGVQGANLLQTMTTLSNFNTRYHNCTSGNQSALAIRDMWQAMATAAGRTDVTVTLFNHTGYTTMQPSVILTIPRGSTSFRPEEIIVLGAHQDSIRQDTSNNCSATARAPGADDDGSGIATLTEVIRVAMAKGYRPLRTVQFMAYAAEEIGLRGSAEIAQSYASATPRKNVVGVMHFDMTAYSTSPLGIYLVNDHTNADQNTFVNNLLNTYLPTVTHGTTVCNYACSDHASWNDRGFPASLPFEANFQPPPAGDNPAIHTINDTLAQFGNNATHALPFAQLGAAYLAEAAKGYLTNPAGLIEVKASRELTK